MVSHFLFLLYDTLGLEEDAPTELVLKLSRTSDYFPQRHRDTECAVQQEGGEQHNCQAPSAHVHGHPGATETESAHHFECLAGVPVERHRWKGSISLSMSVKNTKTKATRRGKGLFHLTHSDHSP